MHMQSKTMSEFGDFAKKVYDFDHSLEFRELDSERWISLPEAGSVGIARDVKHSDNSRLYSDGVTPAAGACADDVPEASLYVLGPMNLVDKTGRIVTPRGRKAQALLALLALAPRGQRTRVWLRDKLWSCSDEKHAATSLRQTIFEIKRDLAGLADHILVVNRSVIGLQLDRLWVDLHAVIGQPTLFASLGLSEDTDLLEGMDIADEEFEDWLMMERQVWFDQAHKLAQHQQEDSIKHGGLPKPDIVSSRQTEPTGYSLGYLPNIQHGCDGTTRYLADKILESVATSLQELQPLTIYDFRDTTSHSEQLMNSCQTEFFVRVRTMQARNLITITFFLYRASSMSLQWSQSIQSNVDEIGGQDINLISGFIAQNVDRLAKSLFEESQSHQGTNIQLPKASFVALNMMFRLDKDAVSNATHLLEAARSQEQNSIYPALQAYLTTFCIGERMGEVNDEILQQTWHIAQSVINNNPFNSISLACLGHVMGYVFGEHKIAAELLESALRLNQHQAFVWDHYALHKLYTGECESAYKAARNAVKLGCYSPMSYSYDTTLCMAATLAGQHKQAIVAGQNALRKQPRFQSAMRYLIANYGWMGRREEAQQYYQQLLTLDPDFRDPKVKRRRLRIGDPGAEGTIIEGLSRAEAG